MFTSISRLGSALLVVAFAAATVGAEPPWPAGDWRGTLDLGGRQMEIVYHLTFDGDAGSGTMDVPAQGAMGLPLQSVRIDGDRLTIEMPIAEQARFEGLRQDEVIDGTFSQAGQSFPLTLERAETAAPPRRPQEPAGPVPYRVEEIFFEGASATRLAGTLTRPDSSDAVPGVVLIAGAGPHDRDGTFANHRPLLVLADRLTRAGFATLRFDERGVGGSGGEFAAVTAEQLAGDIAAAAKFLRRHEAVNPERVGLLAHSEGGRISALAVEAHSAADFLLLLGAPALPGIDGLRTQAAQSSNPVTQLQAAMAEAALRTDVGADIESVVREAAERLLDGLTDAERAALSGREGAIVNQLVQALSQPQSRFSLDFDPRPALTQAGIPVLALYGGKDRQIDAAGASKAWRAALGDNAEIETLPGLNHFFQLAQTGEPSEYAAIEQTISPEALEKIIDWLASVIRDKP